MFINKFINKYTLQFIMDNKTLNRILKMKNMIFDNLMESYLPFPIDKKYYSSWTDKLPRDGDTVIYTSYMYQISGILKKYEKLFPKISNVNVPKRLMGLSKFLIKPGESEIKRSFSIMNNIVNILQKNHINFGYLYDDEPYSGAILLESGFLKEFMEYGNKLNDFFKSRGIKRIITLDPHTTNALKRLKTMINFDIDVKNYIELINFNGSGEYVIHDSCLYSRAMDMYGLIRDKINKSGIKIDEDYLTTSKDMGTCCGGPLSLISVNDSDEIARLRSEKLLKINNNVLVMCPLCYQNLSPHVENIKDLAEVIS